jgi:hypothetical protein
LRLVGCGEDNQEETVAIPNIKDPEVHALGVDLAERPGLTLTQAVKEALRKRLARERAAPSRF